MVDPWRTFLTLILGVLTGVLSAMFGVGGAVLSTPGIRLLGAPPLDAVGTTLPSILPSAVAGSVRFRREGLIRWRVVVVTGAVGALIAVGTSFLSHIVPGRGHLLMVATAGLMALTAVRLGVGLVGDRAMRRPPGPPLEDPLRTGAIGVAAGGLSGLLGVGGGIVMVPGFIVWLRLPVKEAVATSLACVGLLALPATVTHALLGDIDWRYAIPLSVAVIPGAWLGARLAIRATERGLRLTIAVVLGAIALVYGALEALELA